WRWENLAVPAGIRFARFSVAGPSSDAIAPTVRFGPQGLEGNLSLGPLHHPDDAVLSAPDSPKLAVRLRPDGTISTSPQDVLAPDQFLAGKVLSDVQQGRQQVYREFVKQLHARGGADQPMLLAWTKPADMGFTLPDDARRVGSALVVSPIKLERPAPGT